MVSRPLFPTQYFRIAILSAVNPRVVPLAYLADMAKPANLIAAPSFVVEMPGALLGALHYVGVLLFTLRGHGPTRLLSCCIRLYWARIRLMANVVAVCVYTCKTRALPV